MILAFPPIEAANEYGLLAVGGDLEPESLILAYSQGIFPWPIEDEEELFWFSPPKRAVIDLKQYRLSRSMKRTFGKVPFKFEVNKNFNQVITDCQSSVNRTRQHGTWITEDIKTAYIELHKRGYAHSFECYLDNVLVGGVYGVSIGRTFAAESMFYRYQNASKATLWILGQYLLLQGVKWIDCQVINPHLRTLGAIEIPREDFIKEQKMEILKPPVEFNESQLQLLLSLPGIIKKLG